MSTAQQMADRLVLRLSKVLCSWPASGCGVHMSMAALPPPHSTHPACQRLTPLQQAPQPAAAVVPVPVPVLAASQALQARWAEALPLQMPAAVAAAAPAALAPAGACLRVHPGCGRGYPLLPVRPHCLLLQLVVVLLLLVLQPPQPRDRCPPQCFSACGQRCVELLLRACRLCRWRQPLPQVPQLRLHCERLQISSEP